MVKPEIESSLKRLVYDWTSIQPEEVGKELKRQNAECWKVDVETPGYMYTTIKCFYDNKELTIDTKNK